MASLLDGIKQITEFAPYVRTYYWVAIEKEYQALYIVSDFHTCSCIKI